MRKYEKLYVKILTGRSDNNISFELLCQLLIKFNFKERSKGSHHIFYKTGINEILNLQEKGGKAKNYQVKQVRELIIKNKLKIDTEDEL